jgi:hypothetical protein
MDFVDERDMCLIGRVGGRWDRLEKRYVGDAPRSRVIRLHKGQLAVADWFLNWWMERHLMGWPVDEGIVASALVAGGRRGGKTSLLTWLEEGYCVAVPGAEGWIVVPSDVDGYGEEIMHYVEESLPVDWYTFLGSPKWRYDFVNGSAMRFLSGFTPRKVKKGRASIVLMNEAQQIVQSTFNHVRASIADDGGIVLVAANPPDEGDPGTWVGDIASQTQNGNMPTARSFFVDPMENPHIDQRVLESLRDTMSEHEFEVQIRGRFLISKGAVLHAWDRTANERPAPDVGHCTPTFTMRHEGGLRVNTIIGCDFQKYPWLVALMFRAWSNPDAPGDMNQALLWAVDEVYVDEGDEVDLARAIKARGYDPTDCLVVADASGEWQFAERNAELRRAEFKKNGKGSWDMLRSEGFTHIVKPDRDIEKNPDVVERCRATNARIGSHSRKRHLFADPGRCPRTVETIGRWRMNSNGHPDRTTKHAHAGDCLTYVTWRFWPRRFDPKADFQFRALSRYQGKRRVKGFL